MLYSIYLHQKHGSWIIFMLLYFIQPIPTSLTNQQCLSLENSDGLCCSLTAACPRIRPVVGFRELEIRRDAVKLTHKLGAGCFGEVWKGMLGVFFFCCFFFLFSLLYNFISLFVIMKYILLFMML